jgi:hypothetical protein
VDEQQTENAAEDYQTSAGAGVEVQESIAHHSGKDADGGCEKIRLVFFFDQYVSAGGKI